MNKYIIVWVLILLTLSGCVTPGLIKKLPDEGLRYSSGAFWGNMYRRETVSRHPDWSERTGQSILKGSVFTGMTKEQARASWGEAYKVNRTTTQYGVHEQWVYGPTCYLYFDDGILTSIQN